MPFATFGRAPTELGTVVVATAIHNGHDLRPEVNSHMALDRATRLREEDPFTDFFAGAFPDSVIVDRSRFEVDLNRPREIAVYADAEESWGLEVWSSPLPAPVREESLRLYDGFYDDLEAWLDGIVRIRRGFVLYDLHSYNHRRDGPAAPPASPEENPVVNLGTGSLPARWQPVADAFCESMAGQHLGSQAIDARQNVKFRGRQLAAWINERYGEVGCALAIELKKVWMDEWSGEVDGAMQRQLRIALLATVDPVTEAWRAIASH
ncbi:MAG TPA: N-formylglutamate amidohydrolase [Acidimicrobiia bacterium]|nr:N-formylglutamate amidohydrolase [Acidimicrobiia bacterium]